MTKYFPSKKMTACFNLDLNTKTLEYFTGRFLDLELHEAFPHTRTGRKPHIVELSDEDGDALPKGVFQAYVSALEKFHKTYWPGTTIRYPYQMDTEARRKKQEQEDKEMRDFCLENGFDPEKWMKGEQ